MRRTSKFALAALMTELPTIAEAVERIRRGELTPVDLVEHCLARIEEFDEQVRAWVLVDTDGARREAQRLTTLAQRGEFVGPLHGIPIGIKDIIDVVGMSTRAASPLRMDFPPAQDDAPVVAALRDAGAIILGKTVTTEWACFDPPPTRNPWNLNHTPGGSSSGSAAAVAMGMCMAALGTQTGGSIIRPAAYCGVCGLKPTYQYFPKEGVAPVSFHLDHVGPLARCADDLRAMYFAMMRRTWPDKFRTSTPRWCRLDEFFLEQAGPDVLQRYEDALGKLGDATWENAEPLPASFANVHKHHWTIMAVDAAQVHGEAYEKSPEQFSPKVAALIQEGLATSTMEYATALRHKHEFFLQMDRFMDPPVLLVMPSTPTTAPGPETTGDAKFNSPWSYCGRPAVTIPCGLDEQALPVGLQIVGAHHCERELLSAAVWCEERLGSLAYDGLPK